MLKIKYYENEIKKEDGKYYHCAAIDTDEFNGYTMLEQIEPRCKTYDDAKKELLKYVIELRDALNDLIRRELNEI